jgi:hypothetical protein
MWLDFGIHAVHVMLLSSWKCHETRCSDSRIFLEGVSEILSAFSSLRIGFGKKFGRGGVQTNCCAIMGLVKIGIAKAVLYLGA